MSVKYILARTLTEAHAFAREQEFPRGTYRVINSPGSLRAVRGADLYLVEGYQRRFDKFAMATALKWTRLNVIQPGEAPAVADDLEPAGVQLMIPVEPAEADAFFTSEIRELESKLEPVGWEPPETLTADDIFALAATQDRPAAEVLQSVPEPVAEPEPVADPVENVEVEKPKRKRRSRCGECGNLHFKDEACPAESVLPGT